jgi:hypothetical protein
MHARRIALITSNAKVDSYGESEASSQSHLKVLVNFPPPTIIRGLILGTGAVLHLDVGCSVFADC